MARVVGPPPQTALQRQLVTAGSAGAASASQRATASLLASLDEAAFRRHLSDCCPQLVGLAAMTLLESLRAEARASEWVHSFCAADYQREPGAACSVAAGCSDVSLGVLQVSDHFPNQWELEASNSTYPPYTGWNLFNAFWMERAEVGVFGYPRPANFEAARPMAAADAVSRPVYTAMNLLRVDLGFPLLGDVTAVFRHYRLRGATLISAVDTGQAEALCNATSVPLGWNRSSCEAEGCDCAAWRGEPTVGTLEHLDHLLLANARFWKAADLAAVFNRSYAPVWWNGFGAPAAPGRAAAAPPALGPDLLKAEIEPDVLARVEGGAIKLIVASFRDLFGSSDGVRLRGLCSSRGWALVWSLGSVGVSRAASATAAYDQRLLDPDSEPLLVPRRPTPPAVTAAFRALWSTAAAKHSAGSVAEWVALWAELVAALPADSRLRPLNARDACAAGAHVDECVGADAEGQCRCYA